ncbi:MAG: hypothetical protein M8467_17605 [Anaerolineae bacterium]|nr:hypothetical protein [Anaerolineae bacterium]
MMTQQRYRAWAASLLVAVLLMIVVMPAAVAEAPVPADVRAFGGGSPLVVPAAAFSSDGFDPASTFFYFLGGYMRGAATGPGCVQAPVYLPQPAKMADLYASVYDNDPAAGMAVTLWRVNNFTGTTDVLAQAATTGAFASTAIVVLVDYTIDFPNVSYPTSAYYLTTCIPNANLRLYSVRIYYETYEAFLPLVLRNFP